MKRLSLSERMKNYENDSKIKLDSRLPIIVRIDGKSFHSFTKSYQKPFDYDLSRAFQFATSQTMQEIAQVIFAYSQSDEVSILLNNGFSSATESYLAGRTSKLNSVIASIFTIKFNRLLSADKDAFFDCRAFNLPFREIENYFIWRQLDAKRNSISCFGRSFYSHKQMHKLNKDKVLDKLKDEHNFSWEDLPKIEKWGFCVKKVKVSKKLPDGAFITRNKFIIDRKIPLFTEERDYFDKYIWNIANKEKL